MNTIPLDQTANIKDYWELLKPRVMSLVIFTCLCGLILAPNPVHPFIAFVGILCVAIGAGASGCLNQWYEYESDQLMERTKNRPIPGGRISPDSAFAFGMILSLGSVALMYLAVNMLSALLLAGTIFYYVIIYTHFLKPNTPQNIVIGGAAGALPPVIGYVIATNQITTYALSLFFIIFLWTPAHFWALSLKCKDDYAKANIPMLPNIKGDIHTKLQILIYTTLTCVSSYGPWYLNGGAFYLITASTLNIIFLYFAFVLYKENESTKAIPLFLYSIVYLFLIFSFLVVDQIYG
jgi:protoheme IX farnesyltransferase